MVGAAAVELELPPGWTRMHNVFHVSLVKPYPQGKHAVESVVPPQPLQWVDGKPLYEVQEILDYRMNSGRKGRRGSNKRLELLVQRTGYGPENDTWEPQGHLLTCNSQIVNTS